MGHWHLFAYHNYYGYGVTVLSIIVLRMAKCSRGIIKPTLSVFKAFIWILFCLILKNHYLIDYKYFYIFAIKT